MRAPSCVKAKQIVDQPLEVPGVIAARHGAAMGRSCTMFLPLALAGVRGLQATGLVLGRLAVWI